MAMMSGVGLWAASADFAPTRCSFSPGYAVISSETFGSCRRLYSSAMNFWTSTWKPTYCQNDSVVGPLALTRGPLNSTGFLSSPAGAGAGTGWAPPIWAAARLARRSAEGATAESRPSLSSRRRSASVLMGHQVADRSDHVKPRDRYRRPRRVILPPVMDWLIAAFGAL